MLAQVRKFIENYLWFSALIIILLFFLLVNTAATPLFNSGDDTFLMYTLGGGYGEPPSSHLHYNYGWHPWLAAPVQYMFKNYGGINWYSVALLLFHVTGCTTILYLLLKRSSVALALLSFTILFFFFEIRLLLSLTFTGAAFVSGTGAMSLFLHQFQQKRFIAFNTFFAFILLLLSAMLRLHVAGLVILLFGSVAITLLTRKALFQLSITVLLCGALMWGLNKIQVRNYIKNIPGWQQHEKFRQALFYSYNRQLNNDSQEVFSDVIEQQLFFSGFLYDTLKFNTERITEIGKQISRKRSLDNKEDRRGLYWFFIEIRVYLLLFASILGLLLLQRKFLIVKKWTLSFLAFGVVHSYLFIYLKVTPSIHLGLLLFLWLALVLQFREEINFFTDNKKALIPIFILLLLSFGWMGIRVVKENSTNKQKYQRFLCAIKELNQQPNKLFVATDDAFPLHYFYIWNIPKNYPAANLLYKDRLITHTYIQTLERFGIINLEDALLNNKNVFLLGRRLSALEKSMVPAKLSNPFPEYKCLEVRQMNAGK